ncbi:MAG: DcrB-related protein [Verrucomicrobia bacterium]|nr:DcrB-related protein [Verrucomicrobiota bacterium]
MRWFLLALIGILPLSADNSGETFVSERGYQLVIPQGWESGSGLMGADLFAIAPPAQDPNVGTANFNVMTGDVAGVSLEDFYSDAMMGLSNLVDNFKLLDQGKGVVGGKPALWHLYTYNYQDLELEVLQYITMIGQEVYVLTFTTLEADYAYYQPTFEQVVKSLEFVSPPPPNAQKMTYGESDLEMSVR